MMKTKFTWIALTIGLGIVSSRGQGVTHTNALLSAKFQLTAYIQETAGTNPVWTISTRKLGNADVVSAIVTDLGLAPGDYDANSLIFLAKDVVTNAHISFALRSLSGVDTDVTTNLSTGLPELVVTSIRSTPFGRTTNSVDMTVLEFTLGTTNLTFDIQGAVTLKSSSILLGKTVLDKSPFTTSFTASVAGAGTLNGKDAVFTGTVLALNRKIEIKTEP